MPQWEYRAIQLNEAPARGEDLDVLNEAGEEGWELVGITTKMIAYLKRQLFGYAVPSAWWSPRKTTTGTK
jgi:hypothetical protein